MTDVELRPAGDDDLGYVETLLERNGLPTADLRSGPASFYVAATVTATAGGDGDDDPDRVGAGGLERHGTAALLRSVVVEERRRGEGIGTAVCDGLERRAAAAGVETVYLLTTTAAGFFADRGYERVDRSTVPAAVRATTEFESLCPDDATVMRRPL